VFSNSLHNASPDFLEDGTVYHLRIDLKKAYDSVRSEVLYNILIELGIRKKLVGLVNACLKETYRKICIDKHLIKIYLREIGSERVDWICVA
jgi:hypothetical protein